MHYQRVRRKPPTVRKGASFLQQSAIHIAVQADSRLCGEDRKLTVHLRRRADGNVPGRWKKCSRNTSRLWSSARVRSFSISRRRKWPRRHSCSSSVTPIACPRPMPAISIVPFARFSASSTRPSVSACVLRTRKKANSRQEKDGP